MLINNKEKQQAYNSIKLVLEFTEHELDGLEKILGKEHPFYLNGQELTIEELQNALQNAFNVLEKFEIYNKK